jgi:hypothetical protein
MRRGKIIENNGNLVSGSLIAFMSSASMSPGRGNLGKMILAEVMSLWAKALALDAGRDKSEKAASEVANVTVQIDFFRCFTTSRSE